MRADEKTIQQAYVDWVYRLLKSKIAAVETMQSESAARNEFWENKKTRLDGLRRAHAEGALVFGCLDMIDGDAWYIGKAHVDGDGRQEVALMDWRADLAELFYQADRSQPQGVGRRLTFTMSQRLVRALAEDVLTPGFKLPEPELPVAPPPGDAPSRPPLPRSMQHASSRKQGAVIDPTPSVDDGLDLRARDILLDELDRERTGTMHEIVATIQADQDRLIRRATERVTVVQGGPGTGKTVVGLHRAAWVLYQQRSRRLGLQDALVVGPNRAFVDYIGSVLPQLGESTATHQSLADLALLDLPDAERARFVKLAVAEEPVQRVKGDLRMLGFVREAVWTNAIARPLSLSFGRFTFTLSESQVTTMIAGYRKADMGYEQAQQRLPGDVTAALFADAQEQAARGGGRGVGSFAEFSASIRQTLRRTNWVEAVLPTIVPRLAIQRALIDPDVFGRVAKRHLTPTQRALLAPKRKVQRMTWTESDLPLVAEAALVITGSSRRFGHVVVDEAQDLSPMQWRLLARRSSSQSMTVLGDLAQATSVWAPRSWMEALTAAGLAASATVAELEIGYRVPKDILEFACRLLPEIAPAVSIPQSVRSGAPPSAFKVSSARGLPIAVGDLVSQVPDGSVGVIAADSQVEAVLKALTKKGLDVGRGSSEGLSHLITVLDPSTSKGLEFDHVVVVEPSAIAGRSAREKRRLFVALTRATKTLTLVHANLLPTALRGAVEDQELAVELPRPTPRVRTSAAKPAPEPARSKGTATSARRRSPDQMPMSTRPARVAEGTLPQKPARTRKSATTPAPSTLPGPTTAVRRRRAEPQTAEAVLPARTRRTPSRAVRPAQPSAGRATTGLRDDNLPTLNRPSFADAAPATLAEAPPSAESQLAQPREPEPPMVPTRSDLDTSRPAAVEVRTKGLRRLAVRSSPFSDSSELVRVRGSLALIETSGGWARVRTPAGTEGWVPTRELKL